MATIGVEYTPSRLQDRLTTFVGSFRRSKTEEHENTANVVPLDTSALEAITEMGIHPETAQWLKTIVDIELEQFDQRRLSENFTMVDAQEKIIRDLLYTFNSVQEDQDMKVSLTLSEVSQLRHHLLDTPDQVSPKIDQAVVSSTQAEKTTEETNGSAPSVGERFRKLGSKAIGVWNGIRLRGGGSESDSSVPPGNDNKSDETAAATNPETETITLPLSPEKRRELVELLDGYAVLNKKNQVQLAKGNGSYSGKFISDEELLMLAEVPDETQHNLQPEPEQKGFISRAKLGIVASALALRDFDPKTVTDSAHSRYETASDLATLMFARSTYAIGNYLNRVQTKQQLDFVHYRRYREHSQERGRQVLAAVAATALAGLVVVGVGSLLSRYGVDNPFGMFGKRGGMSLGNGSGGTVYHSSLGLPDVNLNIDVNTKNPTIIPGDVLQLDNSSHGGNLIGELGSDPRALYVDKTHGATHELISFANANNYILEPSESYELHKALLAKFGEAYIQIDGVRGSSFVPHCDDLWLRSAGEAHFAKGVPAYAARWMELNEVAAK